MADFLDSLGGLNPALVAFVKRQEGYAPRASWDFKQASYGYGTRAPSVGASIDRDTAERELLRELRGAADVVDRFRPDLPNGVRDALIDLTYNAGSKWTTAGLGEAVRAGRYDTARDMLLQYNKAGGSVLPGLARRRAEAASWMGGNGPAMSVADAGTNAPRSGSGLALTPFITGAEAADEGVAIPAFRVAQSGNGGVPMVDFSALGSLPAVYRQAQLRRALAT